MDIIQIVSKIGYQSVYFIGIVGGGCTEASLARLTPTLDTLARAPETAIVP